MANSEMMELEGTVVEAFPSLMFKVAIDVGGKTHHVMCTLSGKLKMNYIRVLVGDKVMIQMSPYDLTKGRITWRYK